MFFPGTNINVYIPRTLGISCKEIGNHAESIRKSLPLSLINVIRDLYQYNPSLFFTHSSKIHEDEISRFNLKPKA